MRLGGSSSCRPTSSASLARNSARDCFAICSTSLLIRTFVPIVGRPRAGAPPISCWWMTLGNENYHEKTTSALGIADHFNALSEAAPAIADDASGIEHRFCRPFRFDVEFVRVVLPGRTCSNVGLRLAPVDGLDERSG